MIDDEDGPGGYVPPELEYDPTMDRDYPPTKEEPDCGGCNDSGEVLIIRPGHAARYRRCRSCRPTRFELWWASVRRKVRDALAPAGRGTGGTDDEPPF